MCEVAPSGVGTWHSGVSAAAECSEPKNHELDLQLDFSGTILMLHRHVSAFGTGVKA